MKRHDRCGNWNQSHLDWPYLMDKSKCVSSSKISSKFALEITTDPSEISSKIIWVFFSGFLSEDDSFVSELLCFLGHRKQKTLVGRNFLFWDSISSLWFSLQLKKIKEPIRLTLIGVAGNSFVNSRIPIITCQNKYHRGPKPKIWFKLKMKGK